MSENEINLKSFSEAVFQKRDRMRLSLRDLANEVKVSAPTISRLERGNLPDLNTYIKLCEWLGRSPVDFLNKSIELSINPIASTSGLIRFLAEDERLNNSVRHALITMIEVSYYNARLTHA